MNRKPFLERVANYYYYLYKEDIANYCFVFPSKRALMFFQNYLQTCTLRPIFAPELSTINDFICEQCSDLKVLDETALLFELYHSYVELRGELNAELPKEEQREPKTFDEFLFWGRLMIKDFDKLDRYLVDTKSLFVNLKDYKELDDDFQYLEEDTRKVIQDFWKGFELNKGERYGEGVQNFIHFWEELPLLYQKFNAKLREQKATYEGAIYRFVADNASNIVEQIAEHQASKKYIFVGLFALSEAEKHFLKELKSSELADFVWDEDVELLKDPFNPVSKILAKDKDLLGQVQEFRLNEENTFLPEEVQVLRTVSAISQAKALPRVLEEINEGKDNKNLNKAIILPKESLLLPVVSSIPDCYKKLNISMGYPLAATPVAIMISKWRDLLLISRDGRYYPADKLSALLSSELLSEFVPELQSLTNLLYSETRFYYTSDELLELTLKEQAKRPSKELYTLANHLIDEELSEKQFVEAKSKYGYAELSDTEFTKQILHLTIVFTLLEPKKTAEDFLNALILLLKSIYTLSSLPMEILPDEDEESKVKSFELNDFDQEFIYHYIRLSKRLLTLMQTYQESIHFLTLKSCISLLERLVHNIKIPFEGSPLEGLQVLGLLESRSLNFEYLLYLSASEGSLPSSAHQSSLIPYTLQVGFGLPSAEEQDAVSAYQFYQSIAKTKKLILLCGEDDGLGGKGEESRYIKQLRYQYQVKIKERTVEAVPHREELREEVIDKKTIQETLNLYLSGEKSLSISKLLVYARCPLEFYYEAIEGVKPNELPDALSSPRVFGDILHHTMELIYEDYVGKEVDKAYILGLLQEENNKRIRTFVLSNEYYEKRSKHRDSYWLQLELDTILKNVVAILKYDFHAQPFIYLGSEIPVNLSLPIYEGKQEIKFFGLIDRCDLIKDEEGNKRLRILDYKTGGDKLEGITKGKFEDFYDSVLRNAEGEKKAIVQTLFYCLMVLKGTISPTKRDKNGEMKPVNEALSQYKEEIECGDLQLYAGLMLTREISKLGIDFSPYVVVEEDKGINFEYFSEAVEAKLTEALTRLLEELFDEETPFTARKERSSCKYCLHN